MENNKNPTICGTVEESCFKALGWEQLIGQYSKSLWIRSCQMAAPVTFFIDTIIS
jgi:hypothetical protein